MPQPIPYAPTADFSADELANAGGRSTVRTAALDAELSAVAATLAGVRANLALNQRDDGEIRDERVKLHTLAPEVRSLLTSSGVTLRGEWATGQAYAVKDVVGVGGALSYICCASHTSSALISTDIAANRWLLIAAATSAVSMEFVPAGTISATTVQGAVEELDGDLVDLRADLASAATVGDGAGMVGHSDAIAYPIGTVGGVVRAFGGVPQGADPTGIADSTAALRALFDACIPVGRRVVLPGGTYLVSGPISSAAVLAAGGLHVECAGDVTINVSPSASPFFALLTCQTTAPNSSTIRGGRLTLNLNSRASCGVYLRHYGTDGGTVEWGPVTVTSVKENSASATTETQALMVYGRYTAVTLDRPVVDGVTRTNTSGGACKGISINETVGEVRVVGPAVSRVLTGGGAADADGLSIFGYAPSGVYGQRAGRAHVDGGTFTDCQGRSIKLQISEALVDRPTVYRKAVVSIATADIDAQGGGNILIRSPVFDYRMNSGVSPLAAGFYPVSLQQQCTDCPNDMAVTDALLRTEVTMTRFLALTVGASALAGRATLDGLRVQPLGALSTSAFTRAVFEFDAGQVAASVGATHVCVTGVRGNLSGIPLVGHTNFGASVASKLTLEVADCVNTGAAAANSRVLGAVSGSAITSVASFLYRDNANVNDLIGFTSFDYATLPVGSRFHYNLATVSASNGPSLGATGYALVEVLGQLNESSGVRSIRVVKDNANAASTVFQTQTGVWGQIK